jgi:hypothetical protein
VPISIQESEKHLRSKDKEAENSRLAEEVKVMPAEFFGRAPSEPDTTVYQSLLPFDHTSPADDEKSACRISIAHPIAPLNKPYCDIGTVAPHWAPLSFQPEPILPARTEVAARSNRVWTTRFPGEANSDAGTPDSDQRRQLNPWP